MSTLKTLFILLSCCFLMTHAATAQSDIPEVPTEIPAQVEEFKKASSEKALPTSEGSLLERFVNLVGGKYTNEGQEALIPHVYELTPIWEGRSEDTYWFYEGISNAFDSGDPFSRHIISIHVNQDEEVVWTYYYCSLLSPHADVYKSPTQLDHIQIEDLMLLEDCEMVAHELSEDHFLLRTTPGNCRDWNMSDDSYMVFEYHFFPEGAATLPLSFNTQERLIWGDKENYYLMHRHPDGYNGKASSPKTTSP